MSDTPPLTVIVFAFNESENVAPVLSEMRVWLEEHEPGAELVFVDDGSSDDTADVARGALEGMPHQVLRHDTNRGIGAALKTGVRAARAPWVTFMPADGQIEPEAIGTLRGAVNTPDVGAVFSVYEDRDDGLHRKVLSWGVRTLILAVHGVRMRSDGPYLFRRELFDPDLLKPDTFFLNFEFPIRVLADQTPTRRVTIRCRPRRAGESKTAHARRVWGVMKDLLELRVRRAVGN